MREIYLANRMLFNFVAIVIAMQSAYICLSCALVSIYTIKEKWLEFTAGVSHCVRVWKLFGIFCET